MAASTKRWIWVTAIVVVAAVAALFAGRTIFAGASARPTVQTSQVTTGDIQATVLSSAALQPAQDSQLTFGTSGTIAEIDVKRGDSVKKGQTIARLDTTDLQLAVSQAQSSLKSAQSKLHALQAPPATGDVAAAQSSLKSAQAKLAALKAGPTATELSAAQLKVTQAQANLDKTRSTSASAKQQAQIALDEAKRALADAQDKYTAVVQTSLNSNGTLKSGLTQDQINTYNAAYRAVQDAQDNVTKAQLNLNDTTGQETQSVALAQAQLDDTNKQLADVKAGPTAADLAAGQAAVDQAQNNLTKLTAGPTADDLAQAQAAVDQAQVNLETANAKLTGALLTAPFDGAIVALPVSAGQQVAANTQVAELVDQSSYHLDVNVGETDISRVKLNLPVDITFDALGDQVYTGTVTYVSPVATVQQGVVTYLATVTLDPKVSGDPSLRAGMSATAAVITDERQNALLVPNRAVRTEGRQKVVYIIGPNGAQIRVPVTTGISDDTSTEVLGDTPLRPGDAVVVNTPTTTTATGGGGGGILGGFGRGGR